MENRAFTCSACGSVKFTKTALKQHQRRHKETATIMLPEFLAGRILGKSGETHQKIKKDTGSKLHFMEIEGAYRKLVISGPAAKVKKARALVNKILKPEKNPGGPEGSEGKPGGPGGRNRDGTPSQKRTRVEDGEEVRPSMDIKDVRDINKKDEEILVGNQTKGILGLLSNINQVEHIGQDSQHQTMAVKDTRELDNKKLPNRFQMIESKEVDKEYPSSLELLSNRKLQGITESLGTTGLHEGEKLKGSKVPEICEVMSSIDEGEITMKVNLGNADEVNLLGDSEDSERAESPIALTCLYDADMELNQFIANPPQTPEEKKETEVILEEEENEVCLVWEHEDLKKRSKIVNKTPSRHKTSSRHKENFECQICDKHFTTGRKVSLHMFQCHLSGLSSVWTPLVGAPSSDRPHSWLCLFCNDTFMSRKLAQLHFYTAHKRRLKKSMEKRGENWQYTLEFVGYNVPAEWLKESDSEEVFEGELVSEVKKRAASKDAKKDPQVKKCCAQKQGSSEEDAVKCQVPVDGDRQPHQHAREGSFKPEVSWHCDVFLCGKSQSYYYEDHYDTHRKTCLNMAYFQCQDCDYYADNAREIISHKMKRHLLQIQRTNREDGRKEL